MESKTETRSRSQALRKAIEVWAPQARAALISSLPFAVPTLLLAWAAIHGILAKTSGVPAVPLDDAYIHFQFARAIAEGQPLVYSPGSGPVAGATSLLWPMLLALGYVFGLREHSIIWFAWLLGFTALGLLAAEARRACERLTTPLAAAGASALILAFGANVWFAASGMEVIPLAWLMLRGVRRAAEWCERDSATSAVELDANRDRDRRGRELLLLAVAAPMMRPEGSLVSVLIFGAMLWQPRGRSRLRAILPLLGPVLPGLICLAFTGQFGSTTARSKWLPLNPYTTLDSLSATFNAYLSTLLSTLLNGEIWSALFLPRGSSAIAVASLLALLLAGVRRAARPRALLLLLLALGIVIPGTYDCPLCNRLRYLWPFFPAWLIGAATLSDLVAEMLARKVQQLQASAGLIVGAIAGALLGYLPFSLDDLATSAHGILRQQVSLGLWARRQLPSTAKIGLNDTGAITYFSGHTTFDVVGLTTASEPRYWTAGPGSRFEHYERLGRARLPTHFIVYPEWFAIDELLGQELTERYVPDASILGGQRMVAYRADYSLLGSADHPTSEWSFRTRIDALDVADLESEAEHSYALLDASQRENLVVRNGNLLEGARANRSQDRFWLKVVPGGTLLLRLGTELPLEISIRVGQTEQTLTAAASSWQEIAVELPGDSLTPARQQISVRARNGTFTSMHYFSFSGDGR